MRWLDLHGGIPDGHNWSVAMGPQKPAVAFGDSVAPCLCVELKKSGCLPNSGTTNAWLFWWLLVLSALMVFQRKPLSLTIVADHLTPLLP